uniref:SOCS box domain-containing protein n=1 Tax=Arion vulgaris TaxID=1028688 RepID=A0A0B7AYR6_9EUPU
MRETILDSSMSAYEMKKQIIPDTPRPKLSTGTDLYISAGYDYVMKIILLGDQGVGKTSFMKALKSHPDVTKVKCSCRVAPSSDHLEVEIMTNQGQAAFIRLYDTGGQERYRSLTSSYYRGAHGVLLMFDLTNKKSMENLETWLSDLDAFSSASSCVRAVLGSNCAAKNREISSITARKYTESRTLPYMEFDTTHNYNIVESLRSIVDRIAMEVTISPLNSLVIKPCLRSQEDIRFSERKKFTCVC